jgi:hypothetical protein
MLFLDLKSKLQWLPYDSLDSLLDKQFSIRAIENYPAPKRVFILANKP